MLFIIYVSITLSVTSSINASNELDSSLSSRCFKRISIGERLIAYDVTRIIERSNVTGCEQECYIYKCTHFSFGFTPEGNGTCELTTDREISRRQDSDFDLYQITNECVEGKPTGYEQGKTGLKNSSTVEHVEGQSYVKTKRLQNYCYCQMRSSEFPKGSTRLLISSILLIIIIIITIMKT